MQQIKPVKFEPTASTKSSVIFSVKPRTIAVITSIAICASILWFMFTANAVYIDTNPKDTSINIDGGLMVKLGDRYLMHQGNYRLNIDSEGYYSFNSDLTINDEKDQYFSYQLIRLPGHLKIDTGEVTKAEIHIDGTLKGHTPTTIRDIAYGNHQLRISADRYFTFEDTVSIEGMDNEQSIQIDLRQAWADVAFDSTPEGASIFIDDNLVGQTPFTAEIMQGEHSARVKLSGYKDWQDDIDVIASESLQLDAIALKLADAEIFLVSSPPRANVTLNGEYKGLTPIELAVTPNLASTILLFKQGYKPTSRKLNVESGDSQRLNIRLNPELVSVEFDTIPADAKLFVDGKLRGQAKQTIELTSNSHRIEIKKQGYVNYKTTITPHIGIAQQLNVKLKTLRQAKIEQIRPEIITSAQQKLKLFYPSQFKMGASRREPGRGSNETIRNIELTRPFYIGLHEVTNKQYRIFMADHSSGTIDGASMNGEDQPVIKITWKQAALYCNWLSEKDSLALFYMVANNEIKGINQSSIGYRLPTEAEWAWTARVASDNSQLKFPWGKQMPPPKGSGNYADELAGSILGRTIRNYQDGYKGTAPVGSFQANEKGIFDMGGNVAEWVSDFYHIVVENKNSVEVDPMGPESGEFHVIRGSSWAHGTVSELRLSHRDYGNKARDDIGFRIARFLE